MARVCPSDESVEGGHGGSGGNVRGAVRGNRGRGEVRGGYRSGGHGVGRFNGHRGGQGERNSMW